MSKAKLIGLGVAVAAMAATPVYAQTSTSPSATRPSATSPSGAPATRATMPSDIKSAKASELIGKNVYSSTDERIGEIDDIVVSKSGGAPMAVIGVGGFLGIGEKKAAVSFDQLKMQGDKIVAAGLTKDSLKAQAEYKSGDYDKYDRDRVASARPRRVPPAAHRRPARAARWAAGRRPARAAAPAWARRPGRPRRSPSSAPSNAPASDSGSSSGSSTQTPKQ